MVTVEVARPGCPPSINPFMGWSEYPGNLAPKHWKDVYYLNLRSDPYSHSWHSNQIWDFCNKRDLPDKCQVFYENIVKMWPWSKRLLPKSAYEMDEYYF
jgi:hypothetical protein